MVARDRVVLESVMPMMTQKSRLPLQAHRILSLVLGLALLALSGYGEAAQRLESLDFAPLAGNKVQLRLKLSGIQTAPNALNFTIDNPARIVFDFPQTTSALPRQKSIGVGVVRSVNAVESSGRTRFVVNLDKMVAYNTRVEGDTFYIVLDGSASQPAPGVGGGLGMMGPPAQAAKPAAGRNRVSNIDFGRGKNGDGVIVVSLAEPGAPVSVDQMGSKIFIDIPNTELPGELKRRMDVVDFATPVTSIDSYPQDGNVRLVVDTKGAIEHLAYQADAKFTLEVKPVTAEEQAAKKKAEYTGERLSLNFQNIEVRAVLQIIADFTGMNLVTSDAVKGSVTLRLQNVPWDQALDIVLKSKGLAMRQAGNVIMVAPAAEIAEREKQEAESHKQIQELAPLLSDLIQINYAKASEIAAILKAKENSMLSERGNVTVDQRTNALLVRDTAEKLGDIRKLISKLDVPVRQVLIESRVVVANDDFSRDLGVRMGATGARANGKNGVIATTGSSQGTDTMISTGSLPVPLPSLDNRLNVNLPVTSTAGQPGRIALAVLGRDYLLDLELSAMQAEGRGEVISTPRVITANQNQASIEQGVEIPYLTASSSGATTVQFKKAVLGLTVKPQITPDDRIILDLTVSKDSVGAVFEGVPSINTRQVGTQVLVSNGETVVLGGIYEQTRTDNASKIPLLGDIPLLGALFRETSKIDSKSELLIFVTPKILKESLTMR
jgi:type IV pilus assembly protein PilQ